MVSSTLVNVAEDAELRLVRLLGEAAPPHLVSNSFDEDCESSIVNADASGLLTTIVNDEGAIAALFILEPLDEAVSAFSLLAALLDRVRADRPEEEADLAAALRDAVVNSKGDVNSSEEEKAKRRIHLLSALYNLRSDGREKCALLALMVALAGEFQPDLLSSGNTLGKLMMEETASSVPAVVSLLEGWDVSPPDRRILYSALADSIPGSATKKQRFSLLLVETYTDASQVDEAGLEAAKNAAVGAINDPITLFAEQRDMLTLPGIQALATKTETKVLHGLLTVFQEDKLEDYYSFVKENGGEDAVLTPWGLSSEDCVRRMRILSLCSLASEHEEIPYVTVAETLQLPSDADVESWVIAAVSSGLLSAKMDQLQHKVMVERSVVRKFDMEQWKKLQTRFHAWKENVKTILEGFEKSRQGAPSMTIQELA